MSAVKPKIHSLVSETEIVNGQTSDVLRLDKEKLLVAIREMKEADSLACLKAAVQSLKTQLNHAKCVIHSSNNEYVELSTNSLLNELTQVEESLTLERAKYYIQRLEKSFTKTKTNSINDINLNRWKEYGDILTDSLWVLDKRDNSGAHTAGYWGNFIPQIPNQMIKRYTKKGEWVLDAFAGSGTTLIESQRLGRNTIGVELQEHIAEQARKLIASEANKHDSTQLIITADSATVDYESILREHGQEKVQLVIMHPPYYDIIKFSDDPRDLSNAPSLESFLTMISKVASNALSVLDKNRYLVLVIGDKYAKGEWIPLGFAAMNEIMKLGCRLKSIVVKNFEGTTAKRARKELWRYRALAGGFYVFKHEYIFLLRKE